MKTFTDKDKLKFCDKIGQVKFWKSHTTLETKHVYLNLSKENLRTYVILSPLFSTIVNKVMMPVIQLIF